MPYDLDHLDETAWRDLVARFGYRMWAVARAIGLDPADAGDAVQAAWLRLLESRHTIRDPERVGAWLVTTTRHEAVRVARRRAGDGPSGMPAEIAAPDADPATMTLTDDEGRRLWAAVDTLPGPCRALVRLIVMAPDASYAQLSRRLDMPIGSIGPTRIRCLKRLRSLMKDQL
ncbi:RNA polymerase sigma factor [Sphaerisporangium melleum]|uniref:RNA polymerase sigma factor n=1 Tax=Sphaerisporangium melleum TaxID=321316 RepID=A0A917VHE7_9ACTN|nr:sigma-70 family RNA polymerase sigma factor [Sphaerisporangium melleum]GGK82549.1 RNA polymerase sigma factor [Sphaerisporangium melleum]GII71324.1 RNA polymerase sigma factor [Sphaerisporangium melleum]